MEQPSQELHLGLVAADLVAESYSPLLPDASRYSLERF
jgi:hypothetical protein